MNRIFWSIIAFVVLAGQSLVAQSVSLTMEPEQQTVQVGSSFFTKAEFTVKVVAPSGYVGVIELSATCSTLNKSGEGVKINPKFFNISSGKEMKAVVTVTLARSSIGTHTIEVQGLLGTGDIVRAQAEIALEAGGTSAWSIYDLPRETRAHVVDVKRGIGWFTAGDSLWNFNGIEWNRIAKLPESRNVFETIMIDGEGDPWIFSFGWARLEVSLFEWTANNWHPHFEHVDVESGGVTRCWMNEAEEVVLLFYAKGISIYKNGTISPPRQLPGFSYGPYFMPPVIDLEGNIWAAHGYGGSSPNGITKFDPKGNVLYIERTTGGLRTIAGESTNFFHITGFDSDNHLIGSNDAHHTIRYDDQMQASFVQEGFLSKWLTGISHAPDGTMWVRTNQEGLGRFDGTTWWHYTTANSELPSDSVSSVTIDDQNRIWIVVNSYLVLLDGSLPPPATFQEAIATVEGSIEEELTFNVIPNPVTIGSTIRVTIPNPATTGSAAHLSLESSAQLRIRLINALGEEITVLSDAELGAGDHAIPLNADALYPGLYFVQLTTSADTYTRPVIVVR